MQRVFGYQHQEKVMHKLSNALLGCKLRLYICFPHKKVGQGIVQMFITFVALKVLITLAFRQNNFLVIHQFLGVSKQLWISEGLFKRFPRVINKVFHRFCVSVRFIGLATFYVCCIGKTTLNICVMKIFVIVFCRHFIIYAYLCIFKTLIILNSSV